MKPCKSVDYFIKANFHVVCCIGAKFQFGKFFIIKNIFIMKNLIYFRKTVEACVDPGLIDFASLAVQCFKRVSIGWWDLRLSAKILALLRLSVSFFQLRLTKKLKINFFCFKKLNIN